jgi:hypothetical protein
VVHAMNLGFHLTLRQLPDGRLVLAVPLFFRALLLAIGVLILLSVVLTPPDGDGRIFARGNAVPLVISALALLGAAYHERWTFDRPGKAVTHRFGVAFAGVTRRYPLEKMANLQIEGRRGQERGPFSRRGTVVTLWLNGSDGESFRLEAYPPSQRGRAADTARDIAEYCGLPLRED